MTIVLFENSKDNLSLEFQIFILNTNKDNYNYKNYNNNNKKYNYKNYNYYNYYNNYNYYKERQSFFPLSLLFKKSIVWSLPYYILMYIYKNYVKLI